jgi:hypothetical protein
MESDGSSCGRSQLTIPPRILYADVGNAYVHVGRDDPFPDLSLLVDLPDHDIAKYVANLQRDDTSEKPFDWVPYLFGFFVNTPVKLFNALRAFQNSKALALDGVHLAFIRVLKREKPPADLAAACCVAVRKLACNDELCAELAGDGGVQLAIQVRHPLPGLSIRQDMRTMVTDRTIVYRTGHLDERSECKYRTGDCISR